MRHILEGLKRNVRGHAGTCLMIIFSSRGCAVFSPIFLRNFLGGCPNHEKIKKTCTFGWHPEVWLSRHGGKVSKDKTATCSQKQTGSQVNDTFMQNEKTKKNQEDLLGLSASDIGLVFFCFLFAILHAPREGCRELSRVICLQFCMPQGKDAESWVL